MHTPPDVIFAPAPDLPFRVIATGGLDFLYPDLVSEALDAAHARRAFSTLVTGGGHGAADKLVAQWGREHAVPLEVVHAPQFLRPGQKAEALRNQRMVASGADACIVFPGWMATDINDRAVAAGIPTWRPYGWTMPEIGSAPTFRAKQRARS